MKFTALACILGTLSISPVAANTPDLCTADIDNLTLIKPSECDPTGRVGPNITVGSTVYTNDEDHFVIGSPALMSSSGGSRRLKGGKGKGKGKKPDKGADDSIIVYLPGTTDWPGLSSCLLQAVASNGIPTIGLTYGYLRRGDGYRNTRCASLLNDTDATVECLTEQHNDAIFGGTYGADRIYNDAEFWQLVDPRDSIAGRLGLLLAQLDESFPDEGWNAYYTGDVDSYPDSLPMPKWKKITFMGHSQGAGHSAYLAATQKVHGAVLVSGPQDECEGCPEGTKFWIDDKFKSTKITAFAHGDSSASDLEPTLPLMEDNWARMGVWHEPLMVKNVDDYIHYDVCKTPIVSSIAPSDTSPCGRRGHCATALDDSAPVLANNNGDNVYIFAMDIWSTVADVDKCY